MAEPHAFTICVEKIDAGRRLDALITSRISGYSRSLVAHHIRSGNIRVNGILKKPGYRVRSGEKIQGAIAPPDPVPFHPEPIPLPVLYEDSAIIVVSKPAGMVVHPAPGHASGTLANALCYHCPTLEGIGPRLRPGIVHRLDKDTSGALVVAKTASVYRQLADQFKTRAVQKIYQALVYGRMKSDSGTVTLPIGRDPVHRKKMSTKSRRGRSAETAWTVRERFSDATLLELVLKTGRTHQIRVHCASIAHAVVGDPVYGRRPLKKGRLSASRQMLHAFRLGFIHPDTGRWMTFESPVPEDMNEMIERLRGEKAAPESIP